MRLRLAAGTAMLLLAAGVAPAGALELDLPGEVSRIEARYACDGGTRLAVEFVAVGENRLAVVRIDDGEPIVFANVVSASGARYLAGRYEFWDVGETARLAVLGSEPLRCLRR